MGKKNKKIKNKKANWLEEELSSQRVINAFYIFFIFLAIIYAGLIWQFSLVVEKEASFPINTTYPNRLEGKVKKLVSGYPIEEMAPYIAKRDKRVAGFLVAIAKKESNWGKFTPKKQGKECYNFWGYRGMYNATQSGYSCFDSPKQAVEIVGDRIEELVVQEFDTPAKMVVWKCGFDCSWDDPAKTGKWIRDVDFYYTKLYN